MKTKTMSKRVISVVLAALVIISVFTVLLTTTANHAEAKSGDEVVGTKTFNSTLYDYYYDSELAGSSILQGVSQSYTNEAYHTLNNAASDYYENAGVKYPVYFGNFYKQDVNTVFDYTQKPTELYNFTWSANLANRSNPNAVVAGIYSQNLLDGTLAQDTASGSVKVPYFDKEWLTKDVELQAMVLNFSFSYGNTNMTMPYTDGDPTGADTFRLFEVIEPGTNYYFAERTSASGSDCNVLSDNLYSGVEDTQIGINFKFESWGMPDKMSVNILTPNGETVSVPMNADAPNKSFWLIIDKNNSATSALYNQLTAKGKTTKLGAVYEELNFPFDVIDNNGITYYQFSTREYNYDINNTLKDENDKLSGVTTKQNNIYFDGSDWATRSEGVRDWNFEELSGTGAEWTYDNDMGDGFFPNNATDPDSSAVGDYDYKAKRDLKYGYAVKYEIPFTLSSNGLVLDKEGNEVPISFEFMGDDDLVVYIDDELVLDMGGAHKMAKGKIDFSTGKATVTTGTATDIDVREATGDPLNTRFRESLNNEYTQSSGILADFIANNNTYNPAVTHKMTIYYVERGMFNANAYIRFNLPVSSSVYVEKEADYSALTEEQKAGFTDDEFTYNFKLTTINGEDIAEYTDALWNTITNIDKANVNGDTYTFTLKAGESVEFGNIPANIGYIISENECADYSLAAIYKQDMNNLDAEPSKLDSAFVGGVTDGRGNVKYKFVNVANEIPTTTVAPTTEAPTTEAPTTEAPTTVAPTTEPTEAPTTEAPTTEAPTTEAPTTEAPTTEAPTTEAPTTEAPTTEAPTTEAPTTEAPTTEAPTTEAPTTEAPTTEAPTTTAEPATMEVTEPTTLPKPDVPKTGDSNLYVVAIIVAVMGISACVCLKKKLTNK